MSLCVRVCKCGCTRGEWDCGCRDTWGECDCVNVGAHGSECDCEYRDIEGVSVTVCGGHTG